MFEPSELGGELTFGCAAAELVRERLVGRRERQADGVDAVALAGRRRSIGKDVALVRAAAGADYLCPDHAIAGVANIFEMIGRERLGEAWPAGAALELGAPTKQGQAAEAASEDAGPLLVQEYPAKWRFGAMLEENMPLFVVE